MAESWMKYTMTALFGAVIGIVGTVGNITINNNSRIATIEVTQAVTTETLRRIENKIDAQTRAK